MVTESSEGVSATAQLEEEMAALHDQLMSVFQTDWSWSSSVRFEALRTATSIVRAQTAAAALLARLKSEGGRHTFTSIHQGVPPTSEKSKTNVPVTNGHSRDGSNAAAIHGS